MYLTRERPVGWLEELSKLDDTSAAGFSTHLLTSKNWPVKFRLINKDTVLANQVTQPSHTHSLLLLRFFFS